MFTRRRTVIAGRTDGDNDWMVYRSGEPVGRVYGTHISNPELSWMWFVQVGQVSQGYASSLEEALEQVKQNLR